MRRFIYSIVLVLLTASLIFATSKPSLDGRAVVADEGVLPQGLFAKTVGYLPGDSVSVTNPATGITINVLILGSIDPSAGVAILLSPEAADKLFITPESNTQVKITKRTGMLDESVSGSGTVVSSTSTDTLPDSLTEGLDAKLDAVDVALGTPAKPEAPVEPVTAEPEPAEEIAEPVADEPEPIAEIAEPEPENPPAEPAANEMDEASRYTITSVEEIPENSIDSKDDPVYIVEVLDAEAPQPVVEPESVAEPETVTEPVSTTEALAVATMESEPDVAPEPVVEPEPVAVPQPVEDPLSTTEALAATTVEPEMEPIESVASIDEPLEEDPSLIDPFAPIILVPAGENPPEEDIAKVASTTIKPQPLASHTAPVTPPKEGTVAKNVLSKDVDASYKSMVKSLSELEKGKYYVQVATFAEQENIDKLLKEYGSKYPFVMVPLKSGSAMQMMIGPLNVDEYGTVLARFKSLGFNDSFLRKIR